MAEGIDILNLAKTGWEVVKDGKPSAQAQSAYCQAMPSKKGSQGLEDGYVRLALPSLFAARQAFGHGPDHRPALRFA
jgi:hypothetical protein